MWIQKQEGYPLVPCLPKVCVKADQLPIALHGPRELLGVTQPALIYSSYFPVPPGANTLSGVLKSQDSLLIIVFALSLIHQHQAMLSRGEFFPIHTPKRLPHFFILFLQSGENRRGVLCLCGDSFPPVSELAMIACVLPMVLIFIFFKLAFAWFAVFPHRYSGMAKNSRQVASTQMRDAFL